LKDRTLYHLLVIIGNEILTKSQEPQRYSQILEVLNSLKVTKLRQQPYLIDYTLNGIEQKCDVPAELFTFHVRGDLEVRVRARAEHLDLRKSNREQAIKLWEQMVPGCNSISPTEDSSPRDRKFLSAAVLMSIVFGFGVLLAAIRITSWSGLEILELLALGIGAAMTSPLLNSTSRTLTFSALALACFGVFGDGDLATLACLIFITGSFRLLAKVRPLTGSVVQGSVLIVCLTFFSGLVISLLIIAFVELLGHVSRGVARYHLPFFVPFLVGSSIVLASWRDLELEFRVTDSVFVAISFCISLYLLPRTSDESMVRVWGMLALACSGIYSEELATGQFSVAVIWLVAPLFERAYRNRVKAKRETHPKRDG